MDYQWINGSTDPNVQFLNRQLYVPWIPMFSFILFQPSDSLDHEFVFSRAVVELVHHGCKALKTGMDAQNPRHPRPLEAETDVGLQN